MRRYNLKENYDDTFTTVLGLHFDVAKYHFLQGEMILKCTSSLLSVYWQSSEVSTKPPLLPCKVSNKTKLQNEQLRKAKALYIQEKNWLKVHLLRLLKIRLICSRWNDSQVYLEIFKVVHKFYARSLPYIYWL